MAYTTIDKPSDYFNTKLYTSTNSELAISGIGFAPNWVWIKSRSDAHDHHIYDTVRGATKLLNSLNTDAEATNAQGLKSFDSDGFTLGTDGNINESGNETYASWNWKAGTSFTNDASSTSIGSIDSAGSVNTDAGFSITTFTGTGSAGTVAHGLGAIPKFLVVKSRSNANGWIVYHASLGAGKGISINLTDAAFSTGSRWNSTEPTSTVFSLGTAADVNRSSGTHVCYAFSEKKGYSKFGSFAGNGSATDGVFVYLGFKAAWFMCKRTNASGHDWVIFNNKALGYNPDNNTLLANDNSAEGTADRMDILSNGIKMYNNNGSENESGGEYVYLAFAENPFVTSGGVPATAR
tara:strand:+ start:748 stop:1797 length:1050 start_codon:yes stop_codon:yes gene_type:complete